MRLAVFAILASLSAVACSATTDRCPVRTVAVTSYPPAPLPEAKQKSPAPGMDWIPGEWSWDDAHWTWIPGRWLASPNGRSWRPGMTSDDGSGQLVYRAGGFGSSCN